ncbi:MAG TPA: cytochrome c3 family protein, partial [Blastocatellia bacterium]
MRPKLVAVILYGLLLLAPMAFSLSSFASSEPAQQAQAQRVPILFDDKGRRGLVLFDHKKHEAVFNPDSAFPHKAPAGVACTGCHHTVKDVTVRAQFQRCSDCHKEEGNPTNPDDREGFDLNSREAFHRLCISCHKASNFKATNARFTNIGFTKCSECHDREAPPVQ